MFSSFIGCEFTSVSFIFHRMPWQLLYESIALGIRRFCTIHNERVSSAFKLNCFLSFFQIILRTDNEKRGIEPQTNALKRFRFEDFSGNSGISFITSDYSTFTSKRTVLWIQISQFVQTNCCAILNVLISQASALFVSASMCVRPSIEHCISALCEHVTSVR